MIRRPSSSRAAAARALAALSALALAPGSAASAPPGFVTTAPGRAGFLLGGAPFRYGGTNCYYLHYESAYMVDSCLQHAADNNFTVLRMWTWMDVSSCGESGNNGVWFQCRNASSGEIVVNAAAFARLDYAVVKAAALGVRLVMTLTNNWADFGGMDTYVGWRAAADPTFEPTHDAFFSDATITAWYRSWVMAVVSRTNSISGVRYVDDPTLFAWQLANEPRCGGSGKFPASAKCGSRAGTPLIAWVADMSAFVRSLDPNHMISVGDEGFYCDEACGASGAWWCDCSSGVSSSAFAAAPHVSYMTAHLYPDSWGTDWAWGAWWIANHTALAHGPDIGKPFVVEEFGITADQHAVYANWTATALACGADGFQFWMVVGLEDGGSQWYGGAQGDALNIVCRRDGEPPVPSKSDPASCAVLSAAARAMLAAAAEAAAAAPAAAAPGVRRVGD